MKLWRGMEIRSLLRWKAGACDGGWISVDGLIENSNQRISRVLSPVGHLSSRVERAFPFRRQAGYVEANLAGLQ